MPKLPIVELFLLLLADFSQHVSLEVQTLGSSLADNIHFVAIIRQTNIDLIHST